MAQAVRPGEREELTTDTIFALSSGSPPAAIAVVRVSGPGAFAAVEALAGTRPEARRATLVALREGGEELDRALALIFPGPASATGEDLAELHLHGGRATVARVLAALARLPGLRAAAPGEFTRRAFENGRIDLNEAEGLADLLLAETEGQRLSALAMAEGGLSRRVADWQAALLALSARAEALLDHDDEGDVGEDAGLAADVAALREEIAAMLARPAGERLRDGVRVALAGPPNSGKSSLLNALAGREAAIVSPRAGTTRDLIEAPLMLAGRPFVFVDTAGLRASDDEIEAIGVARAEGAIAASDIVLWLGDGDAPAGAVALWARADLPGREDAGGRLAVSAVTGLGLDALVAVLGERADALLPRPGELALSARQRGLLGEVVVELGAVDEVLLLAEGLRRARGALDRLTGRSGTGEMLDALFGRFCIGK